MMKKSDFAKKALGILIIIVGVLWFIGMKSQKEQHFRGIVKSIRTDLNVHRVIIVDDGEYIFLLNAGDRIKPGDFIMKNKDSFDFFWVKKGTNDTIRMH